MSKLLHPDRCTGDQHATEKFQSLQKVYDILMDTKKRQMYDSNGTVEFDEKCTTIVTDEQLSQCKQNYAGER